MQQSRGVQGEVDGRQDAGRGAEGALSPAGDSRELGAPASGRLQCFITEARAHVALRCSSQKAASQLPCLQSFQPETGEPPEAVPHEMAVVPGLTISITGLPPAGRGTARTQRTPLKTNKIPHRGH